MKKVKNNNIPKFLTIVTVLFLSMIAIVNSGVATDSTVIEKSDGTSVDYDYYNDRHLNITAGDIIANLTLPKTIGNNYSSNLMTWGSPSSINLKIGNYSDSAPSANRSLVFNKDLDANGEDFWINLTDNDYYVNFSDNNNDEYINVTLKVLGLHDTINEVVELLINLIPVIVIIAIIGLVLGSFTFGKGSW